MVLGIEMSGPIHLTPTLENIINPINTLSYVLQLMPLQSTTRFTCAQKREKTKEENKRTWRKCHHLFRGQGKNKKRGTMFMTCSVYGAMGHNRQYHQRPDAQQEICDLLSSFSFYHFISLLRMIIIVSRVSLF